MDTALTLYESILADKRLPQNQIRKEFLKLCAYDASVNKRSFAGNKLLYHYMLDVLCQVQTSSGMSVKGEAESESRRQYWYQQMEKVKRSGTFAVRFFEVVRVCRCPINFFKPAIAKYIYKQLNSKRVLDPCAGWGGRLLGALSSEGVSYTGFDTNLLLRPCYENMMNDLVPSAKAYRNKDDEDDALTMNYWHVGTQQYVMYWENSLTFDFNYLDYDTVLTSPPYYNLEIYPGMTRFKNKDDYYKNFLIPLIEKCYNHCKKDGWICINVSPKIYNELITKYQFPVADREYDMLQQIRFGNSKGDKLYCWQV